MPSPEHDQLVDALIAAGGRLTPTIAPHGQELTNLRGVETTTTQAASSQEGVVAIVSGGVECLTVGDAAVGGITLLYLHGGGYVYTRAADAVAPATALAGTTGARVVLPDYRRSPEFPHPAAVDDGLSVYRDLIGSGIDPSRIVVGGDSAGGGLALALLIAAQRANLPAPLACVVFSPWTDLAVSGQSADSVDDPVVSGTGLRMMAETYLAGVDPHSALASPLYATDDELKALPPLLVQVGTREALLDDARRFVARLRGLDVGVEYFEYPGVVHMWMVINPELPESRHSYERAASFIADASRRR